MSENKEVGQGIMEKIKENSNVLVGAGVAVIVLGFGALLIKNYSDISKLGNQVRVLTDVMVDTSMDSDIGRSLNQGLADVTAKVMKEIYPLAIEAAKAG